MSEKCAVCDKPGTFKVREEGAPDPYHLCVTHYRLALVLADMMKESS